MTEIDKHYGLDADAEGRPPRRADDEGWSLPRTARRATRQAGRYAEETYDQASEWARERYDEVSDWAADGYERVSHRADVVRRRSQAEFERGRDGVSRFVEENPVMIGVVGLAAGLLIGALLPGTRRENRYFGRYADEVRDQGIRYAQDMAEQGRHLVEENLRAVRSRADRDL